MRVSRRVKQLMSHVQQRDPDCKQDQESGRWISQWRSPVIFARRHGSVGDAVFEAFGGE